MHPASSVSYAYLLRKKLLHQALLVLLECIDLLALRPDQNVERGEAIGDFLLVFFGWRACKVCFSRFLYRVSTNSGNGRVTFYLFLNERCAKRI